MTTLADCIPEDPASTVWDVVVIGAGAGGATAGFNLARLGRSVLFLERGKLRLAADAAAAGAAATPATDAATSSRSLDAGWWPGTIYERTDDGDVARALPIGCGAGGSTALFAMVMDRFRPVDLTPRRFAGNASGTSLPECWPIGGEELTSYYEQAEALFRVRGTPDPLDAPNTSIASGASIPPGGSSASGASSAPTATLLAPRPPSAIETAIHDTLSAAGLHPYRLHDAREHVPGCTGCPMQLCPRPCRNDAGRMCLVPALERHGARILPECDALRLLTNGCAVRAVRCRWRGQTIDIRARVFVLALNSFLTPALLLRSANDAHPDGLGNSSGQVGRNLMLHVSDTLLVRFPALRGAASPTSSASPAAAPGLLNGHLHHGIAMNDFYVRDGVKLGNVHTHAASLPLASAGSTPAAVFHTIVEDFPYASNHVAPKNGSDGEVVWSYRYPGELRHRSHALVDAFTQALRGRADVLPLAPAGSLNIAHACGTCRFGDDPRTSVLDRDNRVHDLDNLYVVDASFLPTSGGIHPSLTIVANSLRVSENLARR